MQSAGFEIVFATDNNELCRDSHAVNFPSSKFKLCQIQDVEDREFAALRAPGPVDLLIGGPPCPPYSKSRFYLADKPRALADPVGAATLTGYLRALKILKPRAFVLENVAGFGYKVHRAALELLVSTAEDLGYHVNHGKLNAADYGVPQIRERYFVLGSLEGPIEMPTPSHSKARGSLLPPWVTAGDVLSDLDTEQNASDEGHFAGGQFHDLLREIPPGDNYLYFTAKRGYPDPKFEWRSRYWSFLLKLSPEMPSWTIQARRSNNMGPFHWRNRILRIEEIKRLQSFPDDWYLAGRTEEQWRQIGNAVPPLLAEAVGTAVMHHLCSAKAA